MDRAPACFERILDGSYSTIVPHSLRAGRYPRLVEMEYRRHVGVETRRCVRVLETRGRV